MEGLRDTNLNASEILMLPKAENKLRFVILFKIYRAIKMAGFNVVNLKTYD